MFPYKSGTTKYHFNATVSQRDFATRVQYERFVEKSAMDTATRRLDLAHKRMAVALRARARRAEELAGRIAMRLFFTADEQTPWGMQRKTLYHALFDASLAYIELAKQYEKLDAKFEPAAAKVKRVRQGYQHDAEFRRQARINAATGGQGIYIPKDFDKED